MAYMLVLIYCRAHFNSKTNVAVTARVVNEVKALNPNFSTVDIRGIACLLPKN